MTQAIQEQAGTVPTTIHFGSDLLFVPTFEEAGIPGMLGRQAAVNSHVRVGQWVNRGELLIQASLRLYHRDRKPLLPIFPDSMWTATVLLQSPVSGLVVDQREETVADLAEWGSVNTRTMPVLPVLLVPQDEPPQEEWRLYYFREIGIILRDQWRLLAENHAGTRFIRLGERHAQLQSRELQEAIDAMQGFERPRLNAFEVRAMRAGDKRILRIVQGLRAYDLVLRDKLVHLTKLDAAS